MAPLKYYLQIIEGKKKPKFQINKRKLDKKIEQAFEILGKCELCERRCGTNRYINKGLCKAEDKIRVSSYFPHYGEEPFFVPSFTIFFSGCNFSCQYCQNWEISQYYIGYKLSEEELAEIIDKYGKKCKNINFVGGSPTPYLPFILKTLKFVKSDLPVIWNSNFYMSIKSMELLKWIVDVYLSDFKYGNDKCARRLSKVENYTKIVKRNHLLALKDSDLVIRHLVLPNHFECCTKPILEWISRNLGKKVIVNLMDQYRPHWNAFRFEEIKEPLKYEEFKKAREFAEKLDMNLVY
ncbi:MAG: radical SAM protein [Candidatus Aenigmatarchaeota archaeon]